jgi:hypothetical protein
MHLSHFWTRAQGRYQRTLSNLLFKRPLEIHNNVPYISFTFDDFPRSALYTGGEILRRFGLRGTYYASFGLMDTEGPTGMIFAATDIKELIAQGHELGCHTFDHCHSWQTKPKKFEDSLARNRRVLDELFPGATFKTFSYPIIGPRPETKRRAGKNFICCRGGGQAFNAGTTDLNQLKAYFLEKSRNNPFLVKEVIESNLKARGWLIFATHDISDDPTPYGCSPSFFEEIVKCSIDSGAKILPVAQSLDAIRVG